MKEFKNKNVLYARERQVFYLTTLFVIEVMAYRWRLSEIHSME
jgi:hypothetical protein